MKTRHWNQQACVAVSRTACNNYYSNTDLRKLAVASEFPCLHRIPWNSAEIRKFRGNGQIPRLGSKFRGPRKTVCPSNKEQKMRKWMDKGGAKAERGYPGPTRGDWCKQKKTCQQTRSCYLSGRSIFWQLRTRSGVKSYPCPVKTGQWYINLDYGRLFVQQPPK